MAGGILAALLYKFIFDPYARAVTMEEAINRLSELFCDTVCCWVQPRTGRTASKIMFSLQ